MTVETVCLELGFYPGYLRLEVEGDKLLSSDYVPQCIGSGSTSSLVVDKFRVYLSGRDPGFSIEELDMDRHGLPSYTRRVLELVATIPFGVVRTYKWVAQRVGGSPRAVGQALARNPFLIAIPCHRVVSSSGLGGFTSLGGLDLKRALLRHEGVEI